MQGISKSVINGLDKYMTQKYSVIVQFVRGDTRMDVELHSIVHDWTGAILIADWLAQSWLEFWQNNQDDRSAVVIEIWDTTKAPEFVAVRMADRGHILNTPRIVWS